MDVDGIPQHRVWGPGIHQIDVAVDQLGAIGGQFGHTCVRMGNDIVTFPDFPAEIRAPAGTRAGVSGYQIRFGSRGGPAHR